MSPLVQRPRPKGPQKDSADQHWTMLVFESCSAGALAVLLTLAAVMLTVSLYVILVWPLTFWDLTHTGLESYGFWAETAIWSIFAGGTLAGFWCFSGAAFKEKSKAAAPPTRGRK